MKSKSWRRTGLAAASTMVCSLTAFADDAPNPLKNLYWGDTHLHTANSMDAYFSPTPPPALK